MRTEVLTIDSLCPNPVAITRAVEVLRSGGLVAFPTETVYGLGADARNAAAVRAIFAAKGRPSNNPLIVHVADATGARLLTTFWNDAAEQLAARFWPGPLTLVLPRGNIVPDAVTAGGSTVAVRVPAHPVTLALLRAAALPVAAPSANRAGSLSPTLAAHVLASLDGRFDLLLDGGSTARGVESTVVDMTTHPPRLLRPGPIALADLKRVIGPINRGGAATDDRDAPLPSPGMSRRHYAPRTRLECVERNGEARVQLLRKEGHKVGWLALADVAAIPSVRVIAMPLEPAAYAARLYAALHELDAASLDVIVVSLPPRTDEWLTIHDRLSRAAAD